MRTYIYTYLRKNNDRNGNPRHYVTVYRMKKNKPLLVGEPEHDVGYRDAEQAVCDVIRENEKGWGPMYQSKHGTENPVRDAVLAGSGRATTDMIERPIRKRAQIFRVGS